MDISGYHKVSTCANCLYCDDTGVDEEYLQCTYNLDHPVDHDGICPDHTAE
jgi:hypothetical protein